MSRDSGDKQNAAATSRKLTKKNKQTNEEVEKSRGSFVFVRLTFGPRSESTKL